MIKNFARSLFLVSLLGLSGCGGQTKQAIVQKASGIKKKDDLEKALGKPDKYDKAMMFEVWTYKASDGQVNFRIMGDKVVESDTADEKQKQQ